MDFGSRRIHYFEQTAAELTSTSYSEAHYISGLLAHIESSHRQRKGTKLGTTARYVARHW